MSNQVTTNMVDMFSANVFHLQQQKGSRLEPFVDKVNQVGKTAFYDSIGSVAAYEIVGRHADTQYGETPHGRRAVTMRDWGHADLVDDPDKIRSLNDPTSDYAIAAAWAMGRRKDDTIIAAGNGTAYSGVDGTTAVTLGDDEKLVCFDGTTTTGVNLNVKTLRTLKRRFDDLDVDPSLARYISCAPSQIQALLGETELTSSDYNTIRTLVDGNVDTFMGFKFIPMTRHEKATSNVSYDNEDGSHGSAGDGDGTITIATNDARFAMVWASGAIKLAVGMDVRASIDVLPQKNNSTQVLSRMSIGAVRMEEARYHQLICAEL